MPSKNDLPAMSDITPGPVLGVIVAIAGVASAFGLPISDEQSIALISLAGALSVALPGFEAWLRRGRQDMVARIAESKTPTTRKR